MTPLVGRDIEVSLLHEQYLRAASGHGWVTVISGEPELENRASLWPFGSACRSTLIA